MIRAMRFLKRGPRALAVALALTCLSATGFAQQATGVDRLLPEDTLLVISVDDHSAYTEGLQEMPLSKIMAEEEVQTFLDKPMGMMKEALGKLQEQIRQEEGFENFDLSLDELLAGSYGRIFLALTHVRMPDPQAGLPMPDIGLVLGVESLQGAPDWQALAKDLIGRAAKKSGFEVSFQPVEGENYGYEEMVGGKGERPPVLMGRAGDLQLFSISHESLKMVMDRAMGLTQERSLVDQAHYQKAQQQIAIDAAGSMRFYMNTNTIFRIAAEAIKMGMAMEQETEYIPLVDKILDMSGLLSVTSVASAGMSENGVAVSRSWVGIEGEQTGLLKLDPGTPIDLATLKMIPDNATGFAIFSLDVAALYDFVMDAVKAVDEEAYQEIQQGIQGFGMQIAGEGNPPLDLRTDILGNIGPEYIYLQPQSSSAMVPSIFFMAEVRNPDKVVGGLTSLLEFAGMVSGGEFSVKPISYKENQIYQVEVSTELGVPLSPCYGMVDNRLCFSLSVGDLKRHIRRTEKGGPCIEENPEFQRFYKTIPDGAKLSSISYTDVRFTVETYYGQVAMMLPVMTMAADFDLPFEMALLPTTETITKHLYGSLKYSLYEEGGSLAVSYSPIGGEVLGLLAAGGVGAALMFGLNMAEEAPYDGAELVAPTPVKESSEDQVRYDLSNLKAGITIYKLQFNRFPDTLQQLLEPTDAYPNGCLARDTVPADPWGNAYSYKLTETGYILWSYGPNGTDDGGAGDDIKVEKK